MLSKKTAADALLLKMNRHRVGHLATADRKGKPLVVPLCFVCAGKGIYSAVDEKPKNTSRLRRLHNIRENPQVALLVDHYEEDWSRLSYILAAGTARILRPGKEHSSALRLLRGKYPQYRRMNLKDKPVIKISPLRVAHWPGAEARRTIR
jgi:PPOX class probable F420-dependent enzyme